MEVAWLIADIIGLSAAVRVGMRWVRENGWIPWRWGLKPTLSHLVNCDFCRTFWIGFAALLILKQPWYHAFSIGLIGFAYFQTFTSSVEYPVDDVAPGIPLYDDETQQAAVNVARHWGTVKPACHMQASGTLTTSPFMADEEFLEKVKP